MPPPTATRPAEVAPGTHLTGPFTPVVAEVDVPGLEVVGRLPAALSGVYLRNGPNPRFAPIGSYRHPLDGDAMLHRVTIDAGQARYDNRFVRTPMVAKEEQAGRALWPGLLSPYRPGADEVGPALAGTVRAMPHVNVVRHGGRLLALADCRPPYALDDRLDTLGPSTFDGVLPGGICGHPKVDPATGEMLVFCYRPTPPFLTWTGIGPDGAARPMTPVDGVERPVMIHDMAVTARYVVLVVAPLYFDLQAALSGGSLLSWQPGHGTRIALVPRDGGLVRWCHTDAFWVWHIANAHDVDDPAAGNPVVLDYAEWPHPGGLTPGLPARPHLARARIDPAAGTVQRSVVADLDVDFCRIDDREIGRPQAVTALALATGRPLPHPGCRDGLAWHDTRTDAVVQWRPDDVAVGEPVFAPDPGSEGGWWLAFTTSFSTGASSLVVIPAADPAAGPVAEIRMPVRVPLGLHGTWIPLEAVGRATE